jgi:hypothetical protein
VLLVIVSVIEIAWRKLRKCLDLASLEDDLRTFVLQAHCSPQMKDNRW